MTRGGSLVRRRWRTGTVLALLLLLTAAFLVVPSGDDRFVRATIATELTYFAAAEHPSGLWVDHVRFDEHGQMTRGAYHAASRSGFQLAVLLKVVGGAPGFERGWNPGGSRSAARTAARASLGRALACLERFQLAHPRLRGFFPWGRLDETGLVPDEETRSGRKCVKLPAVDQGILAFSLAAVSWRLGSGTPEERELATTAGRILGRMQFGDFFDPVAGRMSGNVYVHDDGRELDRHYYLQDHTESILPVAAGVLHGQVPPTALRAVKPTLVRVRLGATEVVTFRTWRGSWHEVGIPLLFLPLQTPRRRALYRDYLRAHEAWAAEHGLVGFPATAYGRGVEGRPAYLQMGLTAVSSSGTADSQTHTVLYANCLATLIDRRAALGWVRRYTAASCSAGPLGAWESVTQDGEPVRVCSTDAKAMTVLALAGGLSEDVAGYLASTPDRDGTGTLAGRLKQVLEHLDPVE